MPTDDDLPALAYKTSEERQNQEKPDPGEHKIRKYDFSNQFLMIDEIVDAYSLYDDPDFVWPEDVGKGANNLYVKIKGTLYEVYFYNEPDYDFVYFPGDELPEGYEVKITEDYELVVLDSPSLGEDHELRPWTETYLVTENGSGEMEYESFRGFTKFRDYEDPNDPDELAAELVAGKGTYVEMVHSKYTDDYEFFQYLTKEDLEKLPEGTVLADDVAHY